MAFGLTQGTHISLCSGLFCLRKYNYMVYLCHLAEYVSRNLHSSPLAKRNGSLLAHKKEMHLGTWSHKRHSPLSCFSRIKPGFLSRPALGMNYPLMFHLYNCNILRLSATLCRILSWVVAWDTTTRDQLVVDQLQLQLQDTTDTRERSKQVPFGRSS